MGNKQNYRKLRPRAYKKMLREKCALMRNMQSNLITLAAPETSTGEKHQCIEKAAKAQRLLEQTGQEQTGLEQTAQEPPQSLQIPDEAPEKLDPLEQIFLYQSQNVDPPKKVVEVKKEPLYFEVGPSKPPLELDVDSEPNPSANLESLVIGHEVSEAGNSGVKRSARIRKKEVLNQQKILRDIEEKKKKDLESKLEAENNQNDRENTDKVENNGKENEKRQEQVIIQQTVILFQETALQEDVLDIVDIKQEPETDCLALDEHTEDTNEDNADQREDPILENTLRITTETEPIKENQTQNTVDDNTLLTPIGEKQIKELHRQDRVEKENERRKDQNVKKRRGRPPKSLVDKSIVTEKRKRGRPSKPKVVNNEPKRKRGRPPKQQYENRQVNIPIDSEEMSGDDDSEDEYSVFISEEVIDEPIHLEVQGVINFLT